jgi:hypothetical protein
VGGKEEEEEKELLDSAKTGSTQTRSPRHHVGPTWLL